jgi:hypothetical protein
MPSMAGTVVTISPRESLGKLEQLARSRVERDGVAELAAKAADRRQVRQLRRLGHRLSDDPGIRVLWTEPDDGAVYLTVLPAGAGAASWRGEPKIG